ncbi:MAG: hypothetical protein FJY17_09615 [Bacteroidetes bacterium]|nr:hypothetical protein [Bacteroidota bacterium]
MTTHSHRSVAVITYRIADQTNGNPDIIMQEFLGGLDKLDKDGLLIRDMIPADSAKYFDFIRNHSEKATGFLTLYQTRKNYFIHNKEVLSGYDPNIHELYVSNDNSNNVLPQWTVDFKNNFYIIANPIARLIYFVIGFDFTYQGDRPLESFSTLEFFRFSHASDKKISDKYKLHIRHKSNENADVTEISAKHNTSFLLETIIQKVVPGLAHFTPIAKRPSLLHIFPKSYYTEARDLLLYRTLRIPVADVTHVENSTESSIRTSNMIDIAVLNEGASIIDSGFKEANQINEYFKKYFASFILALNQREVLLQFNREVSLINSQDLNNSDVASNSSHLEKQLLNLKKQINIIIFKQVFYSVSHLDELNLLFDKLMDKFKINILLKDSKVSVEEAYSLINSIEREKATKREKEKDAWDIDKDKREKEIAKKTNIMFTIISLISVASVLFDFYIFSGLDEVMHSTINEKFIIHLIFTLLTVVGVIFVWRHITRSQPHQDSDIASR